ncbi:MAG: class I SAM-dependent methyltransferase [Acidobacteriota bacterium]
MVARVAAKSQLPATRYEFKASPYSSHALLLRQLPEEGRGLRVLDVGCADGYLARLLAARGYRVTGIERPGAAAQPFPANVELVEADLNAGLPGLDGRFEFVLCADILEHLREPLQTLSALRAVLAPGGRLIASLPNSGNIYFRLNVLAGRFPAHDRGLFDRTHLHFYTWDGWVELLGRGGFRIESVQPSGIPVGLAWPRWEESLPVRVLERLCYCAARLWKKLFAYQFVVVARPEPTV